MWETRKLHFGNILCVWAYQIKSVAGILRKKWTNEQAIDCASKQASKQSNRSSMGTSEINEPTTNTILQFNVYVSSCVQLWIIDSIFEMRSIFKARTLQLWTTTTLFGSIYVNFIRFFFGFQAGFFIIIISDRTRSRCTLADDDFRQVNKRLTSFRSSALSLVRSIEIDYTCCSTDSRQSGVLVCFPIASKWMCLGACIFRWLTLNWHQ